MTEIPLTEPGWTLVIPDIDTFDLDHVEVLRGPQGSLFGSASMGGAVQYVANVADPHRGGEDAQRRRRLHSQGDALDQSL